MMRIQGVEMRRIAVVGLGIVMGLVFTLGDALAAFPEVRVTRSVDAVFEGESAGLHYRIKVFAGPGEEGQPPPINSAVEFQVFSSPDTEDPIFSCSGPEKTLDASASIDISTGLATASFDGEYQNASCLLEDVLLDSDVIFDLDWVGVGELVNETSHSGEAGEICHLRSAERAAVAEGTVQFTSGPITGPIAVSSSEATIQIEEATLCLRPGAPQSDSE